MKKKIIYQLILDQSGSMNDCVKETISGFNEQVQRIRELEENYPDQKVIINLTVFNHDVVFPIFQQGTKSLKELTPQSYVPNGMTALYDGIGMSIKRINDECLKEIDVDTRIYAVILTDGHENASEKYTYKQISSQIRDLEATGKWSFSYLGATPDAVDIAVRLNISREKATRFRKENMNVAFLNVSENFSKFMTDFDEEDPE